MQRVRLLSDVNERTDRKKRDRKGERRGKRMRKKPKWKRDSFVIHRDGIREKNGEEIERKREGEEMDQRDEERIRIKRMQNDSSRKISISFPCVYS